jgi:hypothetical protein
MVSGEACNSIRLDQHRGRSTPCSSPHSRRRASWPISRPSLRRTIRDTKIQVAWWHWEWTGNHDGLGGSFFFYRWAHQQLQCSGNYWRPTVLLIRERSKISKLAKVNAPTIMTTITTLLSLSDELFGKPSDHRPVQSPAAGTPPARWSCSGGPMFPKASFAKHRRPPCSMVPPLQPSRGSQGERAGLPRGEIPWVSERMRGREMNNGRETDRFDEQEANTMVNRFWCFKIRTRSSGGSTA